MNKTIAIIPARGGSKRLPNKNIKLLGGIPLFMHSVNYARKNGIQKIVISTDIEEIKKIAIANNVQVIDRPKELATGISSTVSALRHVLETIDTKFENVILLQATNPLRPVNLLKEVLIKFKEGNYNSLMTVTRNHQKFGKISSDKFVPFNYQIGQRSQDLEPLYFENGLLYITKSELILKDKIVGENNFPFIVNHPFANIDIDTKEDFEYAEFMYHKYKNEIG